GFLHQRAHAVQLFGCGWAGLLAMDPGPDLAGANVGADVGRDSLAAQAGEIRGQILPALAGSGRATFAEDHGRYALTNHALGVAVGDDGVVGMVVYVDEAGRDGEVGGVDGAGGGFSGEPAHSRNPALADADVTV